MQPAANKTRHNLKVTFHYLRYLFILTIGISIGFNISTMMSGWRCNNVKTKENDIFRTRNLISKPSPSPADVENRDHNATSPPTSGTDFPPFKKLPQIYVNNAEPHNVTSRYWITPSIDFEKERIFMLFIVKSTCKYHERRRSVRDTWGAVRSINGKRFAVIFVVGNTDFTCQSKLREENEKFQDILQADVSDEYQNLPDKVLSAYQWITYDVRNISDFYAFTDDDCAIQMTNTFDYFSTNQKLLMANNSMYCGYDYDEEKIPYRDPNSRYYLSREVYSENRFPAFCHGGLTIMTYNILTDIYRISQVTNRGAMHVEDVYISGILREKLGKGKENIQEIGFARTKPTVTTRGSKLVMHFGETKQIEYVFKLSWSHQITYMTVHYGNKVIDRVGIGKFFHAIVDPRSIDDSVLTQSNFNSQILNSFLKKF